MQRSLHIGWLSAFALVLSLPNSAAVVAQEAAPPTLLPGGASSLSETHGDWTVRCQVIARNQTSERVCAMSQVQANAQGQQVIGVELRPLTDGLEGTLVLPFGLAITQRVTLSIDEADPVPASFSTCVPAGCIVPITANDSMVNALRTGASLTVTASNIEGQQLKLLVPLNGFAAAAQRMEALNQ